MRGFAVDSKVECAIRIVDDGDVKHGDFSVVFNFFRPLDVMVNDN